MQVRNNKLQYNIDVESFLTLPCHVYWKDRKGVILGCNDNQAKSIGFKKDDDVIGKTDFELCWKREAIIYQQHDQEVMQTKKSKVTQEPIRLIDDSTGTALSHKIPQYSYSEEIAGIFGFSTILTLEKNILKSVISRANIKQKILSSNIGVSSDPKLAKREQECVYHLVRGLTAKQIAKELHLSPRTVEFYLERVKNKFNCQSKSELVFKIVNQFSRFK